MFFIALFEAVLAVLPVKVVSYRLVSSWGEIMQRWLMLRSWNSSRSRLWHVRLVFQNANSKLKILLGRTDLDCRREQQLATDVRRSTTQFAVRSMQFSPNLNSYSLLDGFWKTFERKKNAAGKHSFSLAATFFFPVKNVYSSTFNICCINSSGKYRNVPRLVTEAA